MNTQFRLKFSLYLNYFVFAILLNSVGIVILKSLANYNVNEVQASQLELFKDLSIALVSFIIASFLPRIGYKNAMLSGLAIVTFGCLSMVWGNSFNSAKLLFAMVGIAFALIKVSVYSVIGLVTKDGKEHSALMSSIEGVFMFGIALAYFLFPYFNVDSDKDAWLNVYYLLASLSFLSFMFLFFTNVKLDENHSHEPLSKSISNMMSLITKTLVIVFVFSAFLFVMIEQGIMTWLPTFNNQVLKLPQNISIMMSSILAVSLGIGRLLAGAAAKKYSWFYVLMFCLICSMVLVLFVLPKTTNISVASIERFRDLPFLAFAFPLVGLFIAPIYPLLNSAILYALPQNNASAMTGLIVVFSALGGTLGSMIIGWLFKNVGPENAFYYTLIPMICLFICINYLKKLTESQKLKTY